MCLRCGCALLLGCLLVVPPGAAAEAPRPAARTDRHGDPLPAGALARLGTQRFRHLAGVRRAAFSPEGKVLAVLSRATMDRRGGASAGVHVIGLWDAAGGQELRRIEVEGGLLQCFAFSPDGKVLAVHGKGPILLYDVATGERRGRLPGPVNSSPIHGLAFSPDGKTLAARLTETVSLYDVKAGQELRRFARPPHYRLLPAARKYYGFETLAFAPDGKTLATDVEDGTVGLWDVATGRWLRRFGRRVWAAGAVFSPDGKTLAVGSTRPEGGTWNSLRLYDVATARELPPLEHRDRHFQAAYSPDGKTLASWGEDHVLRFWDPATGQERRRIPFPSAARPRSQLVERVCVAYSPDGRTVASWGQWGHQDVVRLWDVATGKERFAFPGHGRHVVSVAFAPDGKTVATAGDEVDAYLVWDPLTGRPLRRFPPETEQTIAIAFSPEGRLLAAVYGDHALAYREVDATGKRQGFRARQVYRHSRASLVPNELAAVKPNGVTYYHRRDETWNFSVLFFPRTHVAVRADQRREILIEGHTLTTRYTGVTRPDILPAVSPDGRLLAAAGYDGVWADAHGIWFWDVVPRKEFHRLSGARKLVGPREPITFLAFSPDGQALASVHEHQTIRVWELATGKERCCFRCGPEGAGAVTFSPDGTLLASAGRRTHTALVWDLTGLRTGDGPRTADLSAERFQTLWAALAGADVPAAWKAISALSASPRSSVPLLHRHLASYRERLPRLVAELDAEQYRVRAAASRELARLGPLAEAELRRSHKKPRSLEMRKRIDQLLKRLQRAAPAAETVRGLRAVEVLERIGGPEAQRTLALLARDHGDTPLGRVARAAQERLAKRPVATNR